MRPTGCGGVIHLTGTHALTHPGPCGRGLSCPALGFVMGLPRMRPAAIPVAAGTQGAIVGIILTLKKLLPKRKQPPPPAPPPSGPAQPSV